MTTVDHAEYRPPGGSLLDRPRPDLISHDSLVYTASFPSGHSIMAAVGLSDLGSAVDASSAPLARQGLSAVDSNRALTSATSHHLIYGAQQAKRTQLESGHKTCGDPSQPE